MTEQTSWVHQLRVPDNQGETNGAPNEPPTAQIDHEAHGLFIFSEKRADWCRFFIFNHHIYVLSS
ncbi:hypothetical protein [Bifidobacterium sp. ESL0790]|uniref:hypothetical protein n=1 Tax=Bifidobacterium sp. ESL0790 TaxID=2983233 RepID=UPI0023F8B69F|nr:hypothetical protein [Bifidobacterium sp. ESL0790]WEV72509.1 hypothetical protein OZY47_00520 [Bifidobacterium sp. ESL0790]